MRIYYTIQTNRSVTGAAYNRVRMLCSGLQEQGIKSKILVFKSSPFTNKFLLKLWAGLELTRYILLILSLKKDDICIIYGENLWLKFLVDLPRSCKLIVERNEYSTHLIRENLNDRHIEKIKSFEISMSKCDGIIVCSSFLKEYYSQFTCAPIFIIPLVVDISKFKIVDTKAQNYIAYCGDFGGNKDGLDTLLESFACVSPSFPHYKLYLIGDTHEDDTKKRLQARVDELRLTNQVVFTGRIPHEEMPQMLGNASMLVLARPANKQAEGGIPSKLAEYLATGRPTLVTRVGELDKYLTDRVDVFFARPDSVEDFAIKITEILNNYNRSSLIGLEGAKSVIQFDYKLWSNQLYKFIIKYVQG